MNQAGKVGEYVTTAVLEKDLQGIISKYLPDAVLVAPEGTFRGRDEIGRFFQGWLKPFSESVVDETVKLEEGGRILVESFFSAIHTDGLLLSNGELLPATGKRIKVRAAEALEVGDGMIKEHRFYYDRLDLFAQLGVDADYVRAEKGR